LSLINGFSIILVGPNSSIKRFQPQTTTSMAGLDRKINLSTLHLEEETKNLPSEASSAVKEHQRKDNANRIRVTEKADRATTEQVLDPRTRMVLYKMINKKVFTEINGCVSTGKEVSCLGSDRVLDRVSQTLAVFLSILFIGQRVPRYHWRGR
jgi:hypothetical protein